MIILGVDPGTAIIGYGLIKKSNRGIEIIEYGCIETDPKFSTAERLNILDKELTKIIKKHKPNKAAVEDIFFLQKYLKP